jgi:hypothetical protein
LELVKAETLWIRKIRKFKIVSFIVEFFQGTEHFVGELKLSWLFAKGPKTISELTPFSSQFPNILYVAVKLKHVNSKTVLGPFANNLLNS